MNQFTIEIYNMYQHNNAGNLAYYSRVSRSGIYFSMGKFVATLFYMNV
jgi:hypothetical protein